MHDLRLALRQLLKHPGSTAVAVLIVDLGLAAIMVCLIAAEVDTMQGLRTE